MFAISNNGILRDSLAGILQLPAERVYAEYQPLPFTGHIVVGIEDLRDANLRFSIRYFLANVEKSIQLFIVKRDWNEHEEKFIDDVVKTEYRRAYELNQAAIDRVNKLPENDWKSLRIEQLIKWRTIPSISYTLLVLDENLKAKIDAVARITPCAISDDDETLSNKPPVLHWTADPLEGEVQFIIQISFPLAGPDESTFREICRSLKPHVETTYEWTGGMLVTSDPVRLHVQRLSDTVIEFAARICVDELEGDEADFPMRFVWPYLAVGLKQAIQSIADHPHMQYSISFIPYGNIFYHEKNVGARVFDATVFTSTALQYNKVGFLLNGVVHHVDISHVFPDGVYPSLARLLAMNPPSPRLSRPESVVESPSLISEPPTPGSLQVTHNRGRRVSFGTIKLMSDQPTSPEVPIVNDEKANGKVDEYIDRMLKQTIDQLAV
ncbi:unnamed protein product [Caenorhabditis bovis]|uniref:Uncharacterized protein n=1 Tax=Caenorhabditis bovis TaxID=2654633 RepID=A0A8S1F2Z7_9PELO|nr:unnamed protein product [Caenorhabditis bovis]